MSYEEAVKALRTYLKPEKGIHGIAITKKYIILIGDYGVGGQFETTEELNEHFDKLNN